MKKQERLRQGTILLEEAQQLIGMMSEVISKRRMVSNQVKEGQLDRALVPEKMKRLKTEFHRYSKRWRTVAADLGQIIYEPD